MRKIPAVVLVLILAVLFGMPAREAQADHVRVFEIINTYYSDYFVTIVGGYEDYCDGNTYYYGTQDANYRKSDKTNCTTGWSTHTCFQNVNGTWVNIACP